MIVQLFFIIIGSYDMLKFIMVSYFRMIMFMVRFLGFLFHNLLKMVVFIRTSIDSLMFLLV